MRTLSWLLSILIHCCVGLYGMYLATPALHVSLDSPVYTVELVELQPKRGRIVEAKKEPAPAPKPKPVAKPEPAPPKVEPAPKPEAKPIAAKPAPKPKAEKIEKKAPAKPKKPEKSREQLLKEALAHAQKDVKWKERLEKKAQEKAHEDALADLRKLVAEEDAAKDEEPGMGGEAEDGAMLGLQEIYALQVKELIQANWRYPSIPVDESLVAGVYISVGPGGHITEYSLIARSGRVDFDESVLKAVEQTEILPPPPGEIREININFNLQDMR